MIAIVAACLTIATIAACGAKTDTNADGKDQAGEVNAEAIFKKNCVPCHGADLKGKMGPKTDLTHVGGRLTKEQIVAQIENGGGGMVAFKGQLSADEINALADWLAAKK